jgi:hypothetical protein
MDGEPHVAYIYPRFHPAAGAIGEYNGNSCRTRWCCEAARRCAGRPYPQDLRNFFTLGALGVFGAAARGGSTRWMVPTPFDLAPSEENFRDAVLPGSAAPPRPAVQVLYVRGSALFEICEVPVLPDPHRDRDPRGIRQGDRRAYRAKAGSSIGQRFQPQGAHPWTR